MVLCNKYAIKKFNLNNFFLKTEFLVLKNRGWSYQFNLKLFSDLIWFYFRFGFLYLLPINQMYDWLRVQKQFYHDSKRLS